MPSGGHNQKHKRAPRRNAWGYTSIQCECCRRPFASNHALINHRSLSRPCYERYFFSSVTNVTSEHTSNVSSPIAVAGSSGTNTSSNIGVRPSSSIRPSSNRRNNASISLVDTVPISTDEMTTEFRDMDEDDDNSDDDKTVEWEESSKSVSSNDDDGNTPSEGIGNLGDLGNGIDNDFNDTPLSIPLNEYNFNDDNSVNNSGTVKSDDDSSLGSDSTVPIPIGGNAAMRAQASEAKSYNYDFPTTPVRRSTVLNQYSTRFQMHEMHSKETVIPLEGGGLGLIIHFNFEAMLNSLLSDPRIRDSLIVNWDNPSKGVCRYPSHVSAHVIEPIVMKGIFIAYKKRVVLLSPSSSLQVMVLMLQLP
eukprot:scaffold116061_cov62-Attheya_sp.AAC.1